MIRLQITKAAKYVGNRKQLKESTERLKEQMRKLEVAQYSVYT